MIAVGIAGKGVTGCLRYVLSEGRDPATNAYRPAAANDDASRVAWISGQGFGAWTPQTRADAETMRRMMEFDARPENQASKTRKCERDCLHLILSWRTGETPSREEMEQAAREALAAVGMEKARAVFVAHADTPHAHLHIVASRMNPETGRAFSDQYNYPKWQKWALDWERRHGHFQCPQREKRSQLQAAIEDRNAAAVLDLMTQRQATFTGKELARELGRVLGKEEAATFKAELLAQADVLGLHDRESGARLDRFTTQGVRKAEAKALAHATALAADPRHQVGTDAAAAALAQRPTMREEQRRAFDHATAAGGLALIDGKAGTGKSYTMAAIRDACEGDGKRVIGLAPTNAVAQDMQRDGFAEARTIHSALFALKNDRDRWNDKTVLMVDEAAMIGTKLMGELLARAHEARAKLILVGDDRQLASIERGGLFGELRERHGAAELVDVTRQRDADHKAAAEMLARGEFTEAVDALDKLGCITRRNHQTEALDALVEQWTKDTEAASGRSRFVFAYTNDAVKQLNAALRAVRRARGDLGEDHEFTTRDGKAAFAEGDRLTFTTTDKRKGITNGAIGTIERIEEQFITLRMDGRTGREFTFDAEQVDAFRHAYAGTIYKGQGRTFDDVYLYHSQHWKDAAAYVALTRHRDDVKLFVSTEVTRDTADLARQLARHDERRASVAFATTEEARQKAMEAAPPSLRYGAASEEVTGHKAEPYHEPPPPEPEPPAPTHVPERTEGEAAQSEDSRTTRLGEEASARQAEKATAAPPQEAEQDAAATHVAAGWARLTALLDAATDPIRAATERLAQLIKQMEGDDPTPVRPPDRAREVRATAHGAAPPAPTAYAAPSPDAAAGREASPQAAQEQEAREAVESRTAEARRERAEATCRAEEARAAERQAAREKEASAKKAAEAKAAQEKTEAVRKTEEASRKAEKARAREAKEAEAKRQAAETKAAPAPRPKQPEREKAAAPPPLRQEASVSASLRPDRSAGHVRTTTAAKQPEAKAAAPPLPPSPAQPRAAAAGVNPTSGTGRVLGGVASGAMKALGGALDFFFGTPEKKPPNPQQIEAAVAKAEKFTKEEKQKAEESRLRATKEEGEDNEISIQYGVEFERDQNRSHTYGRSHTRRRR
jgi:Ti-type conjugative transfer relaxase TraA